MNYSILAIIIWIILSALLVLVTKKEVSRRYGNKDGKLTSLVGRNFVACSLVISACVSILITLLIKSIA